jgi:large subunit ribosomal protein L31
VRRSLKVVQANRAGSFRVGFRLVPQYLEEATTVKRIHPELTQTTVRCASCGNAFATRSTRSEIAVDVCSNCHPAYTGVERPIQSGSRIERFERRRAAAATNRRSG